MAYLRLQDYHRFISQDQLDEVLDEDDFKRLDTEPTSEEEARSYLVQKYDMDRELSALTVYDPSLTYSALSKVYLDADVWSSSTAYTNAQSLALATDGNVYVATANSTNQSPISNPSYWQKLGYRYQFFNGTVPAAEWVWNKDYKTGIEVFYKGKTYTSVQESYNVFPDDEEIGETYWGAGVAYTISANALTDATKWASGDIRCQRLVECVVMCTLYRLYKHTASQNVPAWIGQAYSDSLGWLDKAKLGEVTANLTELPRRVGHRIRITGNQKNVNIY